jgi:hypothetical protein
MCEGMCLCHADQKIKVLRGFVNIYPGNVVSAMYRTTEDAEAHADKFVDKVAIPATITIGV